MRTIVHAIGRMKAGPERELAERYFQRLAKAGPAVGLEFSGVSENPESRAKTAAERRKEEGRKLFDLAEGGVLILLDEHGKNFSSREIGDRIASFRDAGARQLTLAIGGPDGHDESLGAKADLSIAFGAQTWPHQLVRVMLAEQLYRAVTILSGHPYHRD
ncbi:23S rRNA (pseudouridine(1915)-N(3))-methyltransferase RlmH [Chelativorans sp. AA-79]|uniref:23S rRNA (pseudouridine(1915)-N(3))-methyltransferase RlmH n=1 Tax=Chelativorans sp. AA-79 TaxID=3028735 RepID=UPI0023F678CE|nr:23S rRNA (pseudouridine(1915)-N(3))-methyltransferase RlmH [Chelativorans sp. AA-79]WEX11768.1 23S rRNA (pseudouridine(1915)-N(3))-methyltransferase RlmH [Chelativorans sp. AA-79]